MAYSIYISLLAFLAGRVLGQSTITANPMASGIPDGSDVPYTWPSHNVSWIQQHNETWFNATTPNSPWSNATDANGNFEAVYSPGRAPAIPLAVRSPYTSAWISTANNGSLNSQSVSFWDGTAIGWEGLVTVDDVTYEWMGTGSSQLPMLADILIPASPMATTYDSSYSNFTFACGPVMLTASFFSPVIPDDTCRTSIPLSYLTVNVVAMDSAYHNVTLYTDVNGFWVTSPAAGNLIWDIYENKMPVNSSNITSSSDSVFTWLVQLQDQYTFAEQDGGVPYTGQGVFPLWGNFTWSTSQGTAQNLTYGSGYSINQWYRFITGQNLNNVVDDNYRPADNSEPRYAFEHQLGSIGPEGAGNITFTIGNVVQPAVRFLGKSGIESLQPWWTSCYGDLWSMVTFHWNDLSNAISMAAVFEAKLRNDINIYYGIGTNGTNASYYGQQGPPAYWYNGTDGMSVNGTDQFGQQYVFDSGNAYGYLEPGNGCDSDGIAIPNTDEATSYYAITALAARQILAAYELTVPFTTATDTSTPYAFQKEISSNGNVNTVDVIFPAIPFFLWAYPQWLTYVLDPLFYNQENGFYPNSYAMHDLGSRFPNATGHVEGDDEYMPVEESGNMIIMCYAIAKLTNSTSYIQEHYTILKQWATYLIEYSLIPQLQLSTDDFAGELANQTNLAIKGIVGLAAMGEISALLGDEFNANNYTSTAFSYYSQWESFAIDPSGRHTILAYQWRSSWGLLYNTYPSKLLGLDIIPQSLFDMQSAWYPTVSQLWGVPLDSRHYWTKSDWEMWTAATCEPSTRRLFVDALAYWLNTTASNRAFTDLYQTVHEGEEPMAPDQIEFNARPVQGGLFSLLALVAAGTN